MSIASCWTENGRYCAEIKTCCNKIKSVWATIGILHQLTTWWRVPLTLLWETTFVSSHAPLTRLSRYWDRYPEEVFCLLLAILARDPRVSIYVAHYTVYVGTIRSTLEIESHYLLTDRYPADNASICPKLVNDRTINRTIGTIGS